MAGENLNTSDDQTLSNLAASTSPEAAETGVYDGVLFQDVLAEVRSQLIVGCSGRLVLGSGVLEIDPTVAQDALEITRASMQRRERPENK